MPHRPVSRPISKIEYLVTLGIAVIGVAVVLFSIYIAPAYYAKDPGITYADFTKVRQGQTFEQVVEAVGREPYLMEGSGWSYNSKYSMTRDQMGDETLHWSSDGGGAMSVTFKDEWETGLVIRKVWNGPVPEYLNSDFSAPKPH